MRLFSKNFGILADQHKREEPERWSLQIGMRFNAGTFYLLVLVAGNCTTLAAQQTPPSDSPSKGEVVMVSPFNPTYPPLAQQANITGDVELKLEIREDGTIQSASVVSGHPMLTQAALDSARRSHFDCRGCDHAITVRSFTYSFQIVASPGWPCPETSGSHVTQSENHITVMAEPALLYPYFSYTPEPVLQSAFTSGTVAVVGMGRITIFIQFDPRSAWVCGTVAITSANHSPPAKLLIESSPIDGPAFNDWMGAQFNAVCSVKLGTDVS